MVDQGQDTAPRTEPVEWSYRPTRADIRAGIRIRDRIRGLSVVRGVVGSLFAGLGVLLVVKGAPLGSVVLQGLVVLLTWSIPHLQARHVLRLVAWQGEYRATVADDGISATTDHCALTLRWSMFRGYRATPDHWVLLSRDPNILAVDVLPRRGLPPEAGTRVQTILHRHLERV
ncbi:YcxB family protein [Streptomyces sp. NPDC093795]|uniref:YcxB family protein n=1 Tax=Streptomyces sp. NPDC093795 TaxID=3366051 RepID=UPI00380DDFE0